MKCYFFWVCFWFFQDSTNFKTCLLAAVNFCHWRFRWIFHPSFLIVIFDNFSGRRPAVPLAFCQQKSLTKMCRKKIIFLQMVFFTKWLMTKVDRSKNTYFLFCKIFIKSKCHSKKFDFIMLFPNLALTTLSKWILS